MSKKLLLNAEVFSLVTFPTTHSAMAAEKTLEEAGLPILVVPVPREISAGCGLAIRFLEQDYHAVSARLRQEGVATREFYQIRKGIPPKVIRQCPE